MKSIEMVFSTALLLALGTTFASAQMNNRPYMFGSSGMSVAGRQAIVDRKLGGALPENLFRDGFGNVATATKGPGGIVVLTDRAGVQDIMSRGRPPFLAQGPGRWNSFFYKDRSRRYGTSYGGSPSTSSGESIDGWTGNVRGVTVIGGSSVDEWTSAVYYLPY